VVCKMTDELYPWGGEFSVGSRQGCVAVVCLNIDFVPCGDVAIFGPLKTENIGVEKIVANVISNPFIRFVVVCGSEVRGHFAGASLLALHRNGIVSKTHRIVDAPGAIPFVENIDNEAIARFQNQVEIIDLIGCCDEKKINEEIVKCNTRNPGCFGKPFIAIRLERQSASVQGDLHALHARVMLDYRGHVSTREEM